MSLLLAVQRTGGSAVNYSLAGSTGSYAVTGQAATFKVARALSGSAGSYAVTGNAATFKVAHVLSGSAGAYAITGNAGSFKVAHTLNGTAGAYSVTGNAGTLSYVAGTGGRVNYTLSGTAGAYAVTGNDGSFKVSHSLTGAAGSYVVTGQAGSFKVAHALAGSAGAYAITGFAGALSYAAGTSTRNYTLTGDAGAYALSGGDGVFAYSGTSQVAGGYDDEKPKKKRFIVERDGKLLVFSTAQAALDATPQEKPKNIPAKKKKAVTVQVPDVQPEVTVDLSAVQAYADLLGQIEQYNAAYNSAQYEALIALFEQMQEEDDIETLLLAL